MPTKRPPARKPERPAPVAEPKRFSLHMFLERGAAWIALALVLLASIRIAATYTVFNHTSDEPNHIACGMEWWQRGTYTFETQHPPLARIAAALGPYWIGARIHGEVPHDSLIVPQEGTRILYRDHRYDLTLALARLGILPFFWIACAVVYLWGRRYFSPEVALLATFLFTMIPPVLAHAGLATTDMPLTAFVGAAFLSALIWVETPTPRTALIFGACCGLAVISKFSSLPFIPACLGCALILYFAFERPPLPSLLAAIRPRLPSLGLAILAAVVVIWAGFRFSFGRVTPGGIPIPAPELVTGFQAALAHNRFGHHTYLLGKYSMKGFWYYYPVVLAFKTPLALLILFLAGLFLVPAHKLPKPVWQPLALIAGILAVGLQSHINIGVRHILPIYMGIALLAALAVHRLPSLLGGRLWTHAAVAALLVWIAASSLLAHPDYIPYFNELAGSRPENIMVDSDLDWGQDLKRLSRRLQEVGADHVTFFTTLIASLEKEHGFPPVYRPDPFKPSPGWNAVSMTSWKLTRMGLMLVGTDGKLYNSYPDRTLWPDAVPRGELVGKTILLWNVVPTQ